jgi:hypothetical protein
MLSLCRCGQQYGSQSLRIHITNCQDKWEKRESGKPPGEQRDVPLPPAGFDPEEPLPTRPSDIEEFNNRMYVTPVEPSGPRSCALFAWGIRCEGRAIQLPVTEAGVQV